MQHRMWLKMRAELELVWIVIVIIGNKINMFLDLVVEVKKTKILCKNSHKLKILWKYNQNLHQRNKYANLDNILLIK